MNVQILLQEALKDEIQAIQDYDKLIQLDPENADIYKEIRKDELNHSGRLAALLLTDIEDSNVVAAGMDQTES